MYMNDIYMYIQNRHTCSSKETSVTFSVTLSSCKNKVSIQITNKDTSVVLVNPFYFSKTN